MSLSPVAILNIDALILSSNSLSYQFGPSIEGPVTLDFCRIGTKHATTENHTSETHIHHTFIIINMTS